MPHRFARPLATTIALLLALPVTAGPVLVKAGGDQGRGLASKRGDECMVILPNHIVRNTSPTAAIEVVGPQGARGKAAKVTRVGDDSDDIALLRMLDNGEQVCSDRDDPLIKALKDPTLVRRVESGGLTFEPTSVRSRDARTIGIDSTGLSKMMSGSVLVEEGRPAGLLIDAATTDGDAAQVRTLDYVGGILGSWVRGPASDVVRAASLLDVIDRAMKTRPTGDIGHVAAVEQLIRNGSGVPGLDLRGLYFRAAALNHGDLSATELEGADLSRATLVNATLKEAKLGFAKLDEAQLTNANAEQARFYYVMGTGGHFEKIRAAQSNWRGATLATAHFAGADLRGASFAFADLTGADFAGADLSYAFFTGAVVTGASFKGAKLQATDFTGAIGDAKQFTAEQAAQVCASNSTGVAEFELVRVVVSTQYKSGEDYDSLIAERVPYPDGLSNLDRCRPRPLQPAGAGIVWQAANETISEHFKLHLPAALLDKNDRGRSYTQRMRNHIRFLSTAYSSQPALRIKGSQSRSLESSLKSNVARAALKGPAYFDSEAELLFKIRFLPSTVDNSATFWRIKARQWAQAELRGSGGDETFSNQWEPFFPAGTDSQSISEEHVQLFREWTYQRAKAFPTKVIVACRMTSLRSLHMEVRAAKARKQSEVTFHPLRNMYANKAAAANQKSAQLSAPALLPCSLNTRPVLELPKPAAEYSLTVPYETAYRLTETDGVKMMVLDVQVQGLRTVRKDDQDIDVFRVALNGMRMLTRKKVLYPP